MVLTLSKPHQPMTAPDFSLPEPLTGQMVSLEDVRGAAGTLVVFMCNHCPFVKHLDSGLGECGSRASSMGIGMVGISSNDADDYPADAPDKMKIMAQSVWSSFHYLYDESQEVAKSYDAVCTPDIFLFDKDLKLYYHGQFDDSRPGSGKPVTGISLYNAMDALIRGDPIITDAAPSVGCNIKWKS